MFFDVVWFLNAVVRTGVQQDDAGSQRSAQKQSENHVPLHVRANGIRRGLGLLEDLGLRRRRLRRNLNFLQALRQGHE